MGFDEAVHIVYEFHDGRDRSIKSKFSIQVFGDFLDGLVQFSSESEFIRGKFAFFFSLNVFVLADDVPDTFQETVGAFNALIGPFEVFFRRSGKEDEEAGSVSAVFPDNFFRGNDVADGFTHLAAIFQDHALTEQVREWFRIVDHAFILKDFHEETGIQQVKDGVFDAADVLVDGHPVVCLILCEWFFGIVRIAVTQEIPGRIDEGIHRVGFSRSIRAALWTFAVKEGFTGFERRGRASDKVDVFRQFNREIFFRDKDIAAMRAVNDRDRAAPIALAGNKPVTQTVVYFAFADAHIFEFLGDGFTGFSGFQTVKFRRVHKDAVSIIGFIHLGKRKRAGFILDDEFHWEAVFLSEIPVALVVSRYSHDSTSAVFVEDVVRDPDRHAFAGQRMDRIAAGEHAELRCIFRGSDDVIFISHLFDECFEFCFFRVIRDEFFDERVFRSKDHVGDAVDGVDTGGINRNLIIHAFNLEGELSTGGSTDPVSLHGLDAFRPTWHMVEIRKEAVCIVGDLQEPLREVFLDDFILAAPAASFFDLFICKDGVAAFAPVDLCFLLISETSLVEDLEELLCMLVVIFTAGQDFSVPVIGQTKFFLLTGHVVDVGIGPFRRWNAVFDSRIFSRHAEGIKAHRMNDIESLHRLETSDNVTNGVVSDMPHMEIARRVREHFQYIVFLSARVRMSFKCFGVLPDFLPFLFDLLRYVLFVHSFTFQIFRYCRHF